MTQPIDIELQKKIKSAIEHARYSSPMGWFSLGPGDVAKALLPLFDEHWNQAIHEAWKVTGSTDVRKLSKEILDGEQRLRQKLQVAIPCTCTLNGWHNPKNETCAKTLVQKVLNEQS